MALHHFGSRDQTLSFEHNKKGIYAMRIAVLEKDTRLAQLLEDWLRSAGHAANLFHSGAAFAREIDRSSFDAAVIGTSPDDMQASEITASLRERAAGVPMIRILQKATEHDIVAALAAGADDCMPVARQQELLARLDALTRRMKRAAESSNEMLEFGNLSVDQKNRLILRNGERVTLTPKTYNLAVFLLTNSGQLLTREFLLEQIWGRENSSLSRTLDTHISRLRTVLGLTPEFGWQLQSVYQHGYRLDRIDNSTPRVARVVNGSAGLSCEPAFS